MNKIIVIGDIAGNFLTLQALLKQMPPLPFVSLGDMIDRGPKSKEVLDFVKANGQAVLGNHEHLLLDKYLCETDPNHKPYYRNHIWINNGGLNTLESFHPGISQIYQQKANFKVSDYIPLEYIKYLQSLPLYIDTPDYFLSHAPKSSFIKLENSRDLGKGFLYNFGYDPKSELSLIWHRGDPEIIPNKIQVYGHNPYPEVLYHTTQCPQGLIKEQLNSNDKIHALGIDTSFVNILTAVILPDLLIFQQPYID
jgi:serine/threonine protein phosphatase 1